MPVWLQMHSGKMIDLLNPKVEDILLTDIAHSLSNLCRFNGHIDYYSVGQHSILVSKIVSPKNSLYGLMHDAPECYLGDIPTPLKSYLNGRYNKLEKAWMKAVCNRFDLSEGEPDEVKEADKILLVTEKRDLMVDQSVDWGYKQSPLKETIIPLTPRQAKWAFIERFLEISGRGLA
jgi:5'-deoxynucleotidase YfbR-like HD superfamily hydrolase